MVVSATPRRKELSALSNNAFFVTPHHRVLRLFFADGLDRKATGGGDHGQSDNQRPCRCRSTTAL